MVRLTRLASAAWLLCCYAPSVYSDCRRPVSRLNDGCQHNVMHTRCSMQRPHGILTFVLLLSLVAAVLPSCPPNALQRGTGPATPQSIDAALQRDMEANRHTDNECVVVERFPSLRPNSSTSLSRGTGVAVHVYGHNPAVVVAVNGTVVFINTLIPEKKVKRHGNSFVRGLFVDWIEDCLRIAEALCRVPLRHLDFLAADPIRGFDAPERADVYDAGRLLTNRTFAVRVSPDDYRHSLGHAQAGFWGSPFRSALIVVAHGGGYDGVVNLYLGTRCGPGRRDCGGTSLRGPLHRVRGQDQVCVPSPSVSLFR